jgi:hypothetical protein
MGYGMWEEQVRRACVDTGLIDPAAAPWIAPVVEQGEREGLGYDAIARMVRSTGDQITADKKRTLGLRANAKVGQRYIDALSPRGKERPMDAAFLVVQRAMHQLALGNPSDLFESSVVDEVEISFAEDDRTCGAVKKLDGQKFRKDAVPQLPLPDCDAEYCRCLYLPVIA